jgi:ribonuclease P protein component
VVVHLVDSNVDKATSRSGGSEPVRVGFVVARSVGSAVTRNRVKRRLRHLMSARLDTLPAASRVVVRALPAAAEASYRDLGTELDRCLERVSSS